MTRLPILFAALALSAPVNASPYYASDEYHFARKEWTHLDQRVVVTLAASRAEFERAADTVGVKHSVNVTAFSVISTDPTRPCRITMIDPTIEYNPTALGHELHHCLFGRFHRD